MGKFVQGNGPLVVAIRTEGAIILPKALREQLDLRAGDLLEIEVRGRNLILQPRTSGRLRLRGVRASSQEKISGSVRLGGNSVKEKKRVYDR